MKSFSLMCCLCFVFLLSLSGCEKIMLPDVSPEEIQPLTVMTYNVYLGGSADALLSVEHLAQVPEEVSKMYQSVMASDFPGRATAIAASIETYQPHVIGFQEISLIRRESPGNSITQRTPDAQEVVLDFLDILMTALKAADLDYYVAAKVENIDAEMPLFTDTGIVDIRLTDFDVLLARRDVSVSDVHSATYRNTLSIQRLGLDIKRGFVAVDATVLGKTYRVVNTHLEAFDKEIRIAQTEELIESLSDETLPILLLGDFNTPAPDGVAYQRLRAAGYVDVSEWDAAAPANTCCQDADLLNEVSTLSERIDLIFVRPVEFPTQTRIHTVSERLPSGVWVSDHAGVVASLMHEYPDDLINDPCTPEDLLEEEALGFEICHPHPAE